MTAEQHYDEKYFEWQKNIGIFGAKANKIKFEKLISENLKVFNPLNTLKFFIFICLNSIF